MLEFLCDDLKKSLNYLNKNLVYELRVRVGQPTRVNYGGKYEYLSEKGISYTKESAIVCTEKDIERMVLNASERSIYAVEEQIKHGFITTKNGVRIGLAGEFVFANGQPVTIRNISSLCIRIPHKIAYSSNEIYNICCKNELKNILIVSPPGLGKTTILKDLIEKISQSTLKNILICDERGELCDFEIGITCDRFAYADKSTAFDLGIRAMRPDIIVTDEITDKDIDVIRRIIFSGVQVVATAHLYSIESIFENKMNIFDYYAFLDSQKIGKLAYVYDKNGGLIYQNDS